MKNCLVLISKTSPSGRLLTFIINIQIKMGKLFFAGQKQACLFFFFFSFTVRRFPFHFPTEKVEEIHIKKNTEISLSYFSWRYPEKYSETDQDTILSDLICL